VTGHLASRGWPHIGGHVLAAVRLYRCASSRPARWCTRPAGAGTYLDGAPRCTYPTGRLTASNAILTALVLAMLTVVDAAVGLISPRTLALPQAVAPCTPRWSGYGQSTPHRFLTRRFTTAWP
jgi:hypothetical protein